MKRLAQLSFIFIFLWNCAEKNPPNKFIDPVLVRIADLQDKRLSDSLYGFFQNDNRGYRESAAAAFASIQDTSASPALGNLLLEDVDPGVRSSAAFALGQTGGISAVNALIPALTDRDPVVAGAVLDALGKTIGIGDLEILTKFIAPDTLRQEGLAWGFYRLGLRKVLDSVVVARQAEYLNSSYSISTRVAAAHFFARANLPGNHFEPRLADAALVDRSPEVRMAATLGLRKFDGQKVIPVLKKIFARDKDYRVRVNAVRACSAFPLPDSQDIVFGALSDSSVAVQVEASELLIQQLPGYPLKRIGHDIAICKNPRVKANLYGALLNSVPYEGAIKEILAGYERSDVYGKIQLIGALGFAQGPNEAVAISFLSSALRESQAPAIRSAAALALVAFNDHKGLNEKKKKEFVEIYRQAMAGGDPAVIGILSGALGDSTYRYRETVKDIGFLYRARDGLRLPKDIESMQPLVQAIAYFEGKDNPKPLKNTYNHPLDWDQIRTIPRDQRVKIKTNRGELVIRLFVESDPGSVANFVDLVRKKYFDGKTFHRVVSNFVVQTGCNRGDGFGSEDYSIRSEFSPRRYNTGSVGMASAGKDTEGTQWFITHSPTPHLEGRYSLFAELERGFETLDRIEAGDSIIAAALAEN